MNFIWLRKVVFLCGRNKTFRQRDTRVQSAVFFPRHHVTLLYPIISYMRKTVANNFIRRFLTFLFFLALQDVSKQLWSTLYDFPELQNCVKLKEYMDECVRLSWMLAVQVPPMSINYEATEFSEKLHGRFMTSDMTSLGIKYHVWPALIDSKAGVVLYRGTVVTWIKLFHWDWFNRIKTSSTINYLIGKFVKDHYL